MLMFRRIKVFYYKCVRSSIQQVCILWQFFLTVLHDNDNVTNVSVDKEEGSLRPYVLYILKVVLEN